MRTLFWPHELFLTPVRNLASSIGAVSIAGGVTIPQIFFLVSSYVLYVRPDLNPAFSKIENFAKFFICYCITKSVINVSTLCKRYHYLFSSRQNYCVLRPHFSLSWQSLLCWPLPFYLLASSYM